uniref:Pyruvate carboxylase subunit B n=1 Tax=candidate division WOR-3 bacterium TaxID=2052148 RepID=A0A7C6AAN3_UNCW3
MAKRNVKIVDTTFRDAHQSLMATRLRTEDMLPIAESVDKIGFYSLEVWGGATFDVCIRYLNQDPWERLRSLKQAIPNTPLQMLLRGQNLVGYRHYPDDVVKEFIRLARKNGITIFRIFDALNDIRNMEVPIKTAKATGAYVQGAISYTTSPVHTIENFVKLGKELQELGCDSICIKDMAGLISPKAAYDLVRGLKKALSIPIDLHTHCTSGMGPLSYYAACEAEVDIIDTAFSPLAGGSSQPATEIMVASLKDTPYNTGLDLQTLIEIGMYFLKVREKYRSIISPLAEKTDTSVLIHQIPGGMLSNLYAQLKEQKALDKYQAVLEETPRVRKDLGYPPLVTPTSQIVGIQAVINVLDGKRYERVTQEVKDYLLGLYGRPPGPIDEDFRKKIIGDAKPIDCRPADILKPELETRLKEAKELGILRPGSEAEDLITYALYPKVASQFLKGEIQAEVVEETKSETKEEELKVAAVAAALANFLKKDGIKFFAENKSTISPWKLVGLREGLR